MFPQRHKTTAFYAILFTQDRIICKPFGHLGGPMSAYTHTVWGLNPKVHDYMQTWALRGQKRLHIMQSCFHTTALYAIVFGL